MKKPIPLHQSVESILNGQLFNELINNIKKLYKITKNNETPAQKINTGSLQSLKESLSKQIEKADFIEKLFHKARIYQKLIERTAKLVELMDTRKREFQIKKCNELKKELEEKIIHYKKYGKNYDILLFQYNKIDEFFTKSVSDYPFDLIEASPKYSKIAKRVTESTIYNNHAKYLENITKNKKINDVN